MQVPAQITFKDIAHSDAVEARVREKIEKLETYYDRITSCRVVVAAPHRHQHKGKIYEVRVDLTLPGGEIAVAHEGPENKAHEDVYVAIRDAFEAARRQLKKHVRQIRESQTKGGPEPAAME
jgi:ribosomal subunit interface protein